MKKLAIYFWLGILLTAIISVFWYNEWVYQLPTPVPAEYRNVGNGAHIPLPDKLQGSDNKPVFLHFFNPDCPCSRFNLSHFRSLVLEYGDKVDFAVVVMNNDAYKEVEIKEKVGLDLPVSFDTSLANVCGVYSTPQAVILDKEHKLYYRGNYNKSRYCTDKKTNYAEIALNSLLDKKQTVFDRYALTAYGCELPTCNKN